MLNYSAEIIAMIFFGGGGWRPRAHGEWVDTHFQNWQIGLWGAALGAATMSSNQRFVIVEL